ncbi:hypothetical protein V8G54_023959 [Vigna mungo]|uniref:Uncharacterized protein n=1 Tax=Vigna mungo TaxID=3915 RepID=A0AAQ3RS37_VIGMU
MIINKENLGAGSNEQVRWRQWHQTQGATTMMNDSWGQWCHGGDDNDRRGKARHVRKTKKKKEMLQWKTKNDGYCAPEEEEESAKKTKQRDKDDQSTTLVLWGPDVVGGPTIFSDQCVAGVAEEFTRLSASVDQRTEAVAPFNRVVSLKVDSADGQASVLLVTKTNGSTPSQTNSTIFNTLLVEFMEPGSIKVMIAMPMIRSNTGLIPDDRAEGDTGRVERETGRVERETDRIKIETDRMAEYGAIISETHVTVTLSGRNIRDYGSTIADSRSRSGVKEDRSVWTVGSSSVSGPTSETFWSPPWGRACIPIRTHKERVNLSSRSVSTLRPQLLGHSASQFSALRPQLLGHSASQVLSQIWHPDFCPSTSQVLSQFCIPVFGPSASTAWHLASQVLRQFWHPVFGPSASQVLSQFWPPVFGPSASTAWPHRYLYNSGIQFSALRPQLLGHFASQVISQFWHPVFGLLASTARPFGLNCSAIRPHRYLANSGIQFSALRPQLLGHSAPQVLSQFWHPVFGPSASTAWPLGLTDFFHSASTARPFGLTVFGPSASTAIQFSTLRPQLLGHSAS